MLLKYGNWGQMMSSRIIKAFRSMTLKKCKSGNKGFKIIRENLFVSFEVETFEKGFYEKMNGILK